MFGLKRNMLKDIGTGDVVHFTDGTTAKVELVRSTSDDGEYVELQFDTMVHVPGVYVIRCYTNPNQWSNVGWYNKSTGKLAVKEWYNIKEDNGICMNHIVKVDKIGEHLCYTTAKESIEAKYGTIEPCVCERPLLINGGDELHELGELKVEDTVRFRDGQIARVKNIDETEYQHYPHKITFDRVLTFDDGKLCLKEAGYRKNGQCDLFCITSADIITIIPSGLAERAAKVKKEYGQKKREEKMKKMVVSLDKLKAGDRVTFRDGQTVTASEVDYVGGGQYCITFNKKVRMKEPSGIMAVNFEIFRNDGTVTLKGWKNKDIVEIIPTVLIEEQKGDQTDGHVFTKRDLCVDNGMPVDLNKLRVGDFVFIRGCFRLRVSRIERCRDAIHIEYTQYAKPENVKFPTNDEWYSYDGKCIGCTAKKELDIISIAKVETDDKPFDGSAELADLVKEVSELKKQIVALTSLKGTVKKPEVTDDGNMLFANKANAKKKGKPNAD